LILCAQGSWQSDCIPFPWIKTICETEDPK
jgi:hypothetical protein